MLRKKKERSWNSFFILPIGFIDERVEEKYHFPLLCHFKNYYQTDIQGKNVNLKLRNSKNIPIEIHKCLVSNSKKHKSNFIVATSIRLDPRKKQTKELDGTIEILEKDELKNIPHLLKEIFYKYNITLFD